MKGTKRYQLIIEIIQPDKSRLLYHNAKYRYRWYADLKARKRLKVLSFL